jgi:hypothetical protein
LMRCLADNRMHLSYDLVEVRSCVIGFRKIIEGGYECGDVSNQRHHVTLLLSRSKDAFIEQERFYLSILSLQI